MRAANAPVVSMVVCDCFVNIFVREGFVDPIFAAIYASTWPEWHNSRSPEIKRQTKFYPESSTIQATRTSYSNGFRCSDETSHPFRQCSHKSFVRQKLVCSPDIDRNITQESIEKAISQHGIETEIRNVVFHYLREQSHPEQKNITHDVRDYGCGGDLDLEKCEFVPE